MSVLYGTPVIMMDEPLFAVEPTQGERLFKWLAGYCCETGTDIYASVHNVKVAERTVYRSLLQNRAYSIAPYRLMSADLALQA